MGVFVLVTRERQRKKHAVRLRARAILVGAFLVNRETKRQKMQLIPVNVKVLFV